MINFGKSRLFLSVALLCTHQLLGMFPEKSDSVSRKRSAQELALEDSDSKHQKYDEYKGSLGLSPFVSSEQNYIRLARAWAYNVDITKPMQSPWRRPNGLRLLAGYQIGSCKPSLVSSYFENQQPMSQFFSECMQQDYNDERGTSIAGRVKYFFQLQDNKLACVLKNEIKIFEFDDLSKSYKALSSITVCDNAMTIKTPAQLRDDSIVVCITGRSVNTLEIWNTNTQRCTAALDLRSLDVHVTQVIELDSNQLAFAGWHHDAEGSCYKHQIYLWDIKTDELALFTEKIEPSNQRLNGYENIVQLHNGNIAVGLSNGEMKIFDFQTKNILLESRPHGRKVEQIIRLHMRGFASCSTDGKIKIYTDAGLEVGTIDNGISSEVKCIKQLKDGSLAGVVLITNGNPTNSLVKIWDINSQEILATIPINVLMNTITQLHDGQLACTNRVTGFNSMYFLFDPSLSLPQIALTIKLAEHVKNGNSKKVYMHSDWKEVFDNLPREQGPVKQFLDEDIIVLS